MHLWEPEEIGVRHTRPTGVIYVLKIIKTSTPSHPQLYRVLSKVELAMCSYNTRGACLNAWVGAITT